MTHCSSANEACSEDWILGSAVFTTVMSRSSMKIATQMATRVHHFLSTAGQASAPAPARAPDAPASR
jgi:hypothetical protein